jgi:hypothetical protein
MNQMPAGNLPSVLLIEKALLRAAPRKKISH